MRLILGSPLQCFNVYPQYDSLCMCGVFIKCINVLQVQLSLSLHDGRSKRAATGAFQLKHDNQEGHEAHPGVLRSGVDTECSMWSEDTPTR